jgi:hypothetical protein
MSYAKPVWQHAARELKNAAELDPAWRWFARSAMMHALLGPDRPPIGNPEGKKGHCSSSDNLRLIRHYEKGGSGSSGVRV